jgi:hypothetical protein
MLLNIGSSGGPMDGTSALCQSINQAVGPGIPGFVFVTGTSDDGGMPSHAAGTVAPNGTATIQINHGNPGTLYFDLWYSSTDRFDVTITTPHGTYGPYTSPAANNTYDIQNTSDFLYYQLGGSVNFYNTIIPQREIYAQLTGPTGAYSVTLTGTVVTNGHFNASLNPSQIYNPSANSNYFTSYVVPGYNIWDLASATNDICPNDYVHRTNWVDITGVARSEADEGGLGQLWGGTGLGPTYDGRIGVDVSAPGESVFTVYNTNSYWDTFQFNLIQDGLGLYGRADATSAANPLVTGIIALMLQKNPRLDAAMVKQILHQSAKADMFTGAVPNPQWGYGKVSASNALALVQATLPALSMPAVINQHFQALVQPTVPGWQYLLQTSTNLVSWSAILTNTATSNLLGIVDSGAVSGARFYRVFTQ